MILFFYNLALLAALVVGSPWWLWRMASAEKYRAGLGERLGRVRRLKGRERRPVIWVHAVSVGEVLAVSRLVEELDEALPGYFIAISTTTSTGQTLARQRFGSGRVFYCPLDLPWAVNAWLNALNPRLLILAETEFWPNLLSGCARRGIPVAVVNARISDRSWPRYQRLRTLWRPFLEDLTRVLAQSQTDADRLIHLGCQPERVSVAGNLKFDIRATGEVEAARVLKALRVSSRLVVAGSTLEGEEAALLEVWPRLLEADPRLILVLAPRHPERFDDVAGLLKSSGFSWKRRTDWHEKHAGAIKLLKPGEIVLLDTIGELASVYSTAAVAFVGGSLVPAGGHNPLEPIQFGVPTVMGPHYANFRAITDDLRAHEGLRIAEPERLAEVLITLLLDRPSAATVGERGRQAFERQAGATARCMEAILELVWQEPAPERTSPATLQVAASAEPGSHAKEPAGEDVRGAASGQAEEAESSVSETAEAGAKLSAFVQRAWQGLSALWAPKPRNKTTTPYGETDETAAEEQDQPELAKVEPVEVAPPSLGSATIHPITIQPVSVKQISLEPAPRKPVAAEAVRDKPAQAKAAAEEIEPAQVDRALIEPAPIQPDWTEFARTGPVRPESAQIEPAAAVLGDTAPAEKSPAFVSPDRAEPLWFEAREPVAQADSVAETSSELIAAHEPTPPAKPVEGDWWSQLAAELPAPAEFKSQIAAADAVPFAAVAPELSVEDLVANEELSTAHVAGPAEVAAPPEVLDAEDRLAGAPMEESPNEVEALRPAVEIPVAREEYSSGAESHADGGDDAARLKLCPDASSLPDAALLNTVEPSSEAASLAEGVVRQEVEPNRDAPSLPEEAVPQAGEPTPEISGLPEVAVQQAVDPSPDSALLPQATLPQPAEVFEPVQELAPAPVSKAAPQPVAASKAKPEPDRTTPRTLLIPLIPVYRIGLWLSDRKVGTRSQPVRRLTAPVVSIGNLSTGGAGKTPLTVALAKALKARGMHVDVLSRGYGRATDFALRVKPNGTAEEFGDEPLLIAREAGVPVYVAPLRYDAGRLAEGDAAAIAFLGESEEIKPVVHLLDDGFQHRQLARTVDILLLDRHDWTDRLLPAGNLREPLTALRRASVLAIPATDPQLEDDLRGFGWSGPVWRIRRSMEAPTTSSASPIAAFCGIARPGQFFAGLEAAGLKLAMQRAFADHHSYTVADLEQVIAAARAAGAGAVVTTEKDYVRMGSLASAFPADLPLATAGLRSEIEDQEQAVDWLIERLRLPAAGRSQAQKKR